MFGEILAWVDKNVNLAPKRKDWQAPLCRFHFKNLPPDFKNGATIVLGTHSCPVMSADSIVIGL